MYRLTQDHSHKGGTIPAGTLMFEARNLRADPMGPIVNLTAQGDGNGVVVSVERSMINVVMEFQAGDFTEVMIAMATGRMALRNAEPIDVRDAINRIASGSSLAPYPLMGSVKIGADFMPKWARLFTSTTQAGVADGRGIALVYQAGKSDPQTYRFAICEHEPVGSGTPEQTRRGWHPARCRKCGLDLSVDSGD